MIFFFKKLLILFINFIRKNICNDNIIYIKYSSNISCEDHLAWVSELSRVLKPGGLLLQTIHSYELLKRLAMFSPISAPDEEGILRVLPEWIQMDAVSYEMYCETDYTVQFEEVIKKRIPN